MHVVVIFGWKEETPEFAGSLADALGVTVFEARQRTVGGGPAVVASFPDPVPAAALESKLAQRGIKALVLDAAAVCGSAGSFIARRFELGESLLRIETGDRQSVEIPYREIAALLPGMSISGTVETRTVTERQLSLGKTLLSGGIPMTKKVAHEEEVTTEERRKFLYLYASGRLPVVFSQDGMTYDGLGPAKKLSREQNFAYLISELRRLSPNAVYDDRLLTRVNQIKLLGPAQNAGNILDLAAAVLAACLLHSRSASTE
jgi:hypothetical protein